MASSDDVLNILNQIQQGKLTTEEGVRQLNALERGEANPSDKKAGGGGRQSTDKPRWMRIIVTDLDTNKEKINIRLPANVVETGYKMGARYAPPGHGVNMAPLLRSIQRGDKGIVLDSSDKLSAERVVITLE